MPRQSDPVVSQQGAPSRAQDPPAEPASPQMSKLDRIGTGMMDPVYGMAQIGARMSEPGSELAPDQEEMQKQQSERIKSVDETVKKREETIKKESPEGVDLMRLAGNIASPANYVFPVPGAAGVKLAAQSIKAASKLALAAAATRGLVASSLQPVTGDNFGKEKLHQSLLGAAFGAVGDKVVRAASKIISPVLGKVANELLSRGVELTPGQMAQGFLRRAEEAAKSIPLLGHFIRGAEGRSIESFNKAVINQTLEPIGEKLPSTATSGRSAVDYAHLRLSDAYENLLPKLTFKLDTQFASDMGNLRSLVAEMPKPQAEQFESILRDKLATRLKNGSMDGNTLKQVQSELGNLERNYRSSADAAQRQLGQALAETQTIMRSGLMRSNPTEAPLLDKIDQAYAMFTRVQGAATRRAGGKGEFTPLDLLSAIRQADRSVRHGAFARGDALMQEFAEWGQTLLPSKLPDSGTPERLWWGTLGLDVLGAGAVGGAAHMTDSALPIIGTALGIAPYTKLVGAGVRKYVQPRPWRQSVGGAVQSTAPVAAVGGADIANSVFGLGQ